MSKRERTMVPPAEPQSYYGRPVLAKPVWTPEIPAYFFIGGLAGAAAPLAAGAHVVGNDALCRRATLLGLAGAALAPPLLISDLGRPERFYNMLRVVRLTSPMSVGTWMLTTFGGAIGLASGWQFIGFPPPWAGRVGLGVSAFAGPAVSTYTAVLIANTAVPVWHEARRMLPFFFAGSSMAAAGGALSVMTPLGNAGPARAFAVAGALLELGAGAAMQRSLEPRVRATYQAPSVRPAHVASRVLAATGAGLLAARGRRSRGAAVLGGSLLMAGSALSRWAVYKAGSVSAEDPAQTVGPQRERVDARRAVPVAG